MPTFRGYFFGNRNVTAEAEALRPTFGVLGPVADAGLQAVMSARGGNNQIGTFLGYVGHNLLPMCLMRCKISGRPRPKTAKNRPSKLFRFMPGFHGRPHAYVAEVLATQGLARREPFPSTTRQKIQSADRGTREPMENRIMYERIKLPQLSLATFLGFAALGAASLPTMAIAGNGTNPSSQGGTSCKGDGDCLLLEIDCKGTWTDATDAHGTTYGHCSQTSQIDPKSRLKLEIKTDPPKPRLKLN